MKFLMRTITKYKGDSPPETDEAATYDEHSYDTHNSTGSADTTYDTSATELESMHPMWLKNVTADKPQESVAANSKANAIVDDAVDALSDDSSSSGDLGSDISDLSGITEDEDGNLRIREPVPSTWTKDLRGAAASCMAGNGRSFSFGTSHGLATLCPDVCFARRNFRCCNMDNGVSGRCNQDTYSDPPRFFNS